MTQSKLVSYWDKGDGWELKCVTWETPNAPELRWKSERLGFGYKIVEDTPSSTSRLLCTQPVPPPPSSSTIPQGPLQPALPTPPPHAGSENTQPQWSPRRRTARLPHPRHCAHCGRLSWSAVWVWVWCVWERESGAGEIGRFGSEVGLTVSNWAWDGGGADIGGRGRWREGERGGRGAFEKCATRCADSGLLRRDAWGGLYKIEKLI